MIAVPTGARVLAAQDRRLWTGAGAAAFALHAAVIGLLLAPTRTPVPPLPEPVMLVDLPPAAAPAREPQREIAARPQPAAAQAAPAPLDAPRVRATLPTDPLVVPPAAPQPAGGLGAAVPPVAPPQAPAPTPVAGPAPGDARSKRAELDYFSLLSAHLNRRKAYPAEARKARDEGVVTVRFTVDRDGNVSAAAVKRSSGSGVLDAAALDLLRRVAPLPKMPPTMQRDTVTIALPIEYTLKTS